MQVKERIYLETFAFHSSHLHTTCWHDTEHEDTRIMKPQSVFNTLLERAVVLPSEWQEEGKNQKGVSFGSRIK